MATKKKTTETARVKAAVGRERRLALALRAVLDAAADSGTMGQEDNAEGLLVKAEEDASKLLTELGYTDLESIPRRLTRLNDALKQAMEAGDGKLIAQLGEELDRAQRGLPPSKAKVKFAGKSRTRTTTSSTAAADAGGTSSSEDQ